MRKIRHRSRVGAIDGWEAGRSEGSGVDASRPQRSHEWQRTVDVTVPVDAPADELLRVLTHQPCFAFAISDLLPPVRARGRAMSMPDEGRRSKTNLPPVRLDAPADVHVVAGPSKQRIEAANRGQRMRT